ncbi:hypothetical protein CMV_014501 [Castanea mollissima]|uniref:Uncharacterized protein n=1 Tax=Castanea mollissima TaxID=60419 RepID=A0A8J4VKW3_9ROSI|nr:hypothetical protein CMV_014501 [Castanea mollissima]
MNHLFMDANGFGQIEIGSKTEGPGLEVNGCGCYIEAESCKLLPELGSAEVWASSHNSMIILRVQANRRTEVVVVIGVAGMDWTHRKHCH